MSRRTSPLLGSKRRFPRVSGDEPETGAVTENSRAFSPRERG